MLVGLSWWVPVCVGMFSWVPVCVGVFSWVPVCVMYCECVYRCPLSFSIFPSLTQLREIAYQACQRALCLIGPILEHEMTTILEGQHERGPASLQQHENQGGEGQQGGPVSISRVGGVGIVVCMCVHGVYVTQCVYERVKKFTRVYTCVSSTLHSQPPFDCILTHTPSPYFPCS